MNDEICELNVYLDDNVSIQDYDNSFKKFKQWIEFKREIKLTSLLESKRVQFDIEDINSYKPICGFLDEQFIVSGGISDIRFDPIFTVTDMSFIINGDNVDSLKIKIKKLTTYSGNVFNNLIKDIPDIKLKQKLVNDYLYFYILDIKEKRV